MAEPKVFVPKPECMVASGECFTLGKCLAKCASRAFYQHQADLRRMREDMNEMWLRIYKLEKKQ